MMLEEKNYKVRKTGVIMYTKFVTRSAIQALKFHCDEKIVNLILSATEQHFLASLSVFRYLVLV